MFGVLSRDTFSIIVEKVANDCNIDDLMNLCRVNNGLRKLVYSALDKFQIKLHFQKTTEFDMDFFSKYRRMNTYPNLVIYNSYSEKFLSYYADCFDFNSIDFSKAQYTFEFISDFRDRINRVEFSKNYKFTYDFIVKCESEQITDYNALQYNKFLPYKILVDYSIAQKEHPMPNGSSSYVDFLENVDYSRFNNFEQTVLDSNVRDDFYEEFFEIGNEIGNEIYDNEKIVMNMKANWNKINSPNISIDWSVVSANIELREKELSTIEDYIDYSAIVANPTLTYNIVQKYIDRIDMNALTRIFQLTEEQIMQLQFRITQQNLWHNILQYQKLTILLIKNINIKNSKQKWLSLSKNKNLTPDIIELFSPVLNPNLIRLHNPNTDTKDLLKDELFYNNIRNN